MFIPFHLHSSRSIAPISSAHSPKNAFRRYFGANTTWYLQFHFVCDKLCTSFILFDLLLVFLAVARPQGYYTPKGVFMSCCIAIGFFELPGLAGGFLYTKSASVAGCTHSFRLPPNEYCHELSDITAFAEGFSFLNCADESVRQLELGAQAN